MRIIRQLSEFSCGTAGGGLCLNQDWASQPDATSSRRRNIVSAFRDSRPTTLIELLARAANGHGARVAVREGNIALDWPALTRRVEGVAMVLAEAGISAGTPVALWLPNGIDYLVAIFALARLGAPAVHINTRLGVVEVSDILSRTRAAVLVTRSGFGAINLSPVLTAIDFAALPALASVLFTDAALTELPIPVRLLPEALDGRRADGATPQAAALVYTSSGTTARPKLIVHDQASIAGHAHDVALRIGLNAPSAKLLAAVPFCGTFGNVAAMAAVAGGAEIICLDVFDADNAAALVREHGITHLFGDDRMIGRLAAASLGTPFDSVCFSAVAAFHPDAVSSIDRGIAAGLAPHSIYGSSEVQALFALARQTSGEQVPVLPVSPVAAARLVAGELLLRGPSTFREYLGDPERTAQARNSEGYFHSGDHAVAEGAGFRFKSRIDDVLRLGGFLVNPREIEDFLQSLAGIVAAQVVAVAQDGRSLPFAFLIAKADSAIDESSILAACRASLARYKVPVRALLVDQFPTVAGPNGEKIQRGRLREIAQKNVAPEGAANDAAPIEGFKIAEIAA